MIYLGLYLSVGTVYCLIVDRYSSSVLGFPSMKPKEIFLQIILWPVGVLIFFKTFLKEVFSKKNK